MKHKISYFLLVICSLVLPVIFLRDAMTGVAFLVTMIAVFGAGRAFHNILFPSGNFEFNSFGIGFILLACASFITALLELNAVYFMLIYILAAGYGFYWLLNYFRKDTGEHRINWIIIAIYLVVLALNIYPTLLIQGYSHDNVFSWVNNDAAGYTSIANQVKLGIYPVTYPGFGIEKLYYHDGAYLFGGLVANIFHLPAAGSLFGIIRPLAVLSVLLSLISIGVSAHGRTNQTLRIAGALIGFFLIGSLTSAFEYLPIHISRIDHGMKHLRGFLIGHSSLWIFAALVPMISLLNEKIMNGGKFNFIKIVLLLFLAACGGSLNIVASIISLFLVLFFILLYDEKQADNPFQLKRNLVIISLPLVLLLAALSAYLHISAKEISASAFFLPVFDLGTWSNFLMIFFILYIGIRLFGLNYLSSKTEKHFGYIQFIVLMAALSLMVLIGFFIEPKGGRENDIKYGYILIEGVFGLFSGIWFAERIGHWWMKAQQKILIKLQHLVLPLVIIFSTLLLVSAAGFINSKMAPGLVSPYLKSVIIPIVSIIVLLLIQRYKKTVAVNKAVAFSIFGIACLASLPGCLYEFNKYRDLKDDDEAFEVSAADIKIVDHLNEINSGHKAVLVSVKDPKDENFGFGYTYSSLVNAPVINEASNYFGVKNRPKYKILKQELDSFYNSNNIVVLKSLADKYSISYFIFNTKIVDPSLFDSTGEFKFESGRADSIYILKYLHAK